MVSQKVENVMAKKKVQDQGEQIMRNEAYFIVRRMNSGCIATQKLSFLRSHQGWPCISHLIELNTRL
jgi:hypothetical protein